MKIPEIWKGPLCSQGKGIRHVYSSSFFGDGYDGNSIIGGLFSIRMLYCAWWSQLWDKSFTDDVGGQQSYRTYCIGQWYASHLGKRVRGRFRVSGEKQLYFAQLVSFKTPNISTGSDMELPGGPYAWAIVFWSWCQNQTRSCWSIDQVTLTKNRSIAWMENARCSARIYRR